VAAERDDAGRFVAHAHDMRTAFLELQAAIHGQLELDEALWRKSALRVFKIDAVFS
jgi:hypothetical protein